MRNWPSCRSKSTKKRVEPWTSRRGESFGFLGFDFRRVRSLRGVWRAHYTPKLKKRTALLRKLKDVFRRHPSQPVDRVVKLINPVLRGWVNYYLRWDTPASASGFVKDWVEKKIRRHLLRARNRQGFGWARGGVKDGCTKL